jgi:hypothetical protein
VTRQIEDRRNQWGDGHVTACILRGLAGEPGWFFAREGPVAVGTPWEDPRMVNFASASVTSTQSLVIMREPGHGA